MRLNLNMTNNWYRTGTSINWRLCELTGQSPAAASGDDKDRRIFLLSHRQTRFVLIRAKWMVPLYVRYVEPTWD
jgi:hypothetical protein